jgi:hypothetical protein
VQRFGKQSTDPFLLAMAGRCADPAGIEPIRRKSIA